MYQLETSTGLHLTATTVETIVSALTLQFDDQRVGGRFSWSVTTPHGTVVSDGVEATTADGPTVAGNGVEHAYGLLVRDHLSHAVPTRLTGLLRTS